jgi:hypothetical protein
MLDPPSFLIEWAFGVEGMGIEQAKAHARFTRVWGNPSNRSGARRENDVYPGA